MQFFVVFTPKQKLENGGIPPDFPQLLAQEEARAKSLYAEGSIRQSWVLGKKENGAACLFEAKSPEHLQEFLESFPLIKAGYSDVQTFPLAPDPAFFKQA